MPSGKTAAPLLPSPAADSQQRDLQRRASFRSVKGRADIGVSSHLCKALGAREFGVGSSSVKACINLGQRFLPLNYHGALQRFGNCLFCGKFSRDGSLFASACQDATIRLYTTDQLLLRIQQNDAALAIGDKPPCAPRPYRTIRCRHVGWSIIGCDFSTDKTWVAYSSWSPRVYIANCSGDFERHEGLEISNTHRHFCLFSIQFSPSNSMLLGGSCDNSVYVYDLPRKTVSKKIEAHIDDVNAVTYFGASDCIIISGSDDSLIKVWDLRCPDKTPSGMMVGHQAGITSLASKGNDCHFVSNSKDQTAKLWDMRRMGEASDRAVRAAAYIPDWDYRGYVPPTISSTSQARDDALMTFRGHRVRQTLIQCRFSPEATTGGRYIYTGSSDGSVWIYDTLVGPEGTPRSWRLNGHGDEPVRDVAWHPTLPLLCSSSWDCELGLWSAHGSFDYMKDYDGE